MAKSYKNLVLGKQTDQEEEDVPNWESGYAPYEYLYYRPGERLSVTVKKLTDIISDILEELENNRGPIDEFVIGKTFARKKKRQTFDPRNFKTWRLAGGVDGRWNTTYKPDGFDGLIVLCAFIMDSLPEEESDNEGDEDNEEATPGPLFNKQDFTLAVEQQLIHYFAYEKKDSRLGNCSLCTGKHVKKKHEAKAYVIYMAFKMECEE